MYDYLLAFCKKKMPCSYVQGFAINVLINAVCKIHRFLQFPTADRDPAGNFEKLTICRTAVGRVKKTIDHIARFS